MPFLAFNQFMTDQNIRFFLKLPAGINMKVGISHITSFRYNPEILRKIRFRKVLKYNQTKTRPTITARHSHQSRSNLNQTGGILRFVVILWLMTSSGLWTTILCQEIPAIITFDRNDYHAGNKNWGFAEDDEGNLYVANTEGILIFNGMNWQMVTLPNHRVPRCIYRGYDGKIYAGGFETIGYIDRTDPSRPLFVEIGQKILKGTEEEIWNITGNESQIMFQSFSMMIFQDENGLELYQPQDNIMFGRWIGNGLYVPRIQQGLYVFENGHERSAGWNDKQHGDYGDLRPSYG